MSRSPSWPSALSGAVSNAIQSSAPYIGTLILFGCAFALIASTAFYRLPSSPPDGTVTLPIEVLGYSETVIRGDGATVQGRVVGIEVDITDPTDIDSLFIRGHNLTYHWDDEAWMEGGSDEYTTQASVSEGGPEMYDTKAAWRVNGGPWQHISDERSTCLPKYEAYGCLEGPIAKQYLELHTDATGAGTWVDGTNVIEFKFGGIGVESSGYRILGLDVRSRGQSRIGSTEFVWENPNDWTAPEGFEGDVAAGEALWTARNTLLDNFQDRNVIVASCADCHARDGRDLKYFNFSNESIVARSVHHGFTEDEGRQIAAFVRSADVDLPGGYTLENAGRPWNPMYQPGPGLDNRPVELWAAGAGADCVLSQGDDGAKFLFPSASSESIIENVSYDPNLGVNCDDVANQIMASDDRDVYRSKLHPDSTINLRETPRSVMWADVFEWWPDVHPFEEWGVSAVENSSWYQNYEYAHDILSTERASTIQTAREMATRFGDEDRRVDKIMESLSWFSRWEPTMDSEWASEFKKRYSLKQFFAFKTWEIMHEYSLEGLHADVYGPEGEPERRTWGPEDGPLPNNEFVAGQDRVWFNQVNVFDTSPHKNQRYCCGSSATRFYDTAQRAGTHRNSRSRHYWGDIWYDTALTLAPGGRQGRGNSPFDWNYNFPHVAGTHNNFTPNQGFRYYLNYIASVQHHAQTLRDPMSGDYSERIASWPGALASHTPQKIEIYFAEGPLHGMDQDLRDHLLDGVVNAWFVQSSRFSPEGWRNANDEIEAESYTPQRLNRVPQRGSYADAIYTAMFEWSDSRYDGTVSAQTLDRAARWGQEMWPNGNWDQWLLPRATQSIQLEEGWNLISSYVQPDPASMPSVFADIASNIQVVRDEDMQTYSPLYDINTIGDWSVEEGFKVYSVSPTTLDITGITQDPSTDIQLSEGWNIVPYYATESMSPAEAFASIEAELVLVKDAEGNAYSPDPDLALETLTTVRPGGAYKVYVSAPTTLSYPVSTSPTQMSSTASSP